MTSHTWAASTAFASFVADIRLGAYQLARVEMSDAVRAAELADTYANLDLGIVDASVIALAERSCGLPRCSLSIAATSQLSGPVIAQRSPSCLTEAASQISTVSTTTVVALNSIRCDDPS